MPRPALSIDDIAAGDLPVRIAVLLVRRDKAEAAVKVTGPVDTAVRAAFAHPRLTAALQTLQMDADRLINRIVSRWEHPGYEDETQHWEKSNGLMTVRWWIDREDPPAPQPCLTLEKSHGPSSRELDRLCALRSRVIEPVRA